ncbi:hypothetical protein [Curtobacterium sp. MCSS17_016]|uniref:hypothetical protein n=1 Tax=Curtobacterium sp. MCSS17_016 TaxID=2175644 RepID=UPI000DA88505|nr:hypothetical protein [Curtobacterium sp. MCSS17_016]WIE81402.1 hypothetical protein DEJ19_019395 [Curtobacterium sp. MCSS17_016]
MTDTITTPPTIDAWETENGHAVVLGAGTPAEVATIWNAYIADSYTPGTDEYNTGFTNAELVRMHWKQAYVALPLPDGENEDLDLSETPTDRHGTVIHIAERAEPALSPDATVGVILSPGRFAA